MHLYVTAFELCNVYNDNNASLHHVSQQHTRIIHADPIYPLMILRSSCPPPGPPPGGHAERVAAELTGSTFQWHEHLRHLRGPRISAFPIRRWEQLGGESVIWWAVLAELRRRRRRRRWRRRRRRRRRTLMLVVILFSSAKPTRPPRRYHDMRAAGRPLAVFPEFTACVMVCTLRSVLFSSVLCVHVKTRCINLHTVRCPPITCITCVYTRGAPPR